MEGTNPMFFLIFNLSTYKNPIEQIVSKIFEGFLVI